MIDSTMSSAVLAIGDTHHRDEAQDELSAAKALLEVSPLHCAGLQGKGERAASIHSGIKTLSSSGLECLSEYSNETGSTLRFLSDKEPRVPIASTSLSGALDALATLASEARSQQTRSISASNERQLDQHLAATGIASPPTSSSEDDDESFDSMPPPPPRRRPRSCSNPEGIEKWDSLTQDRSTRRHFVLPASILEEELAEASEAIRQRKLRVSTIPEEPADFEGGSPSPDAVVDHPLSMEDEKQERKPLVEKELRGQSTAANPVELGIDESNLSPDELLKRARSRLLEDLSEGNMNGDKDVMTLPHSLGKYKEVYNKNGRIGIYTPAERAAIIARFNKKRQRRVWNKKIRYNCRKSLADRRLRVKGRFVKRSEQEQLAKELKARVEREVAEIHVSHQPIQKTEDARASKQQIAEDQDMPDVTDPEAGFAPTEDQPFRRLRRHTIT